MATSPPPKKKQQPKKIGATPLQLAAGVPVPVGRPVKIVISKRKFVFSA
jgi:hypothetical protein